MSQRKVLIALLSTVVFTLGIAHAQTSGPIHLQIPTSGQGTFQPQPLGQDGLQPLEVDDLNQDADNDAGDDSFINRTLPTAQPHSGNTAHAGKKSKSNPELNLGFDGLNFRQQRLANGGNQFSIEPPDQGLCAGNGFVLESTNDVLNVFDTSGNQLLGVTDLNSFYGYPAASQRWYHLVLTLERINVAADGLSNSQSLSGVNHLDLAVSNTANPLGGWTIYKIPVQDDGTQGTPDHHCAAAPGTPPPGRTNPHACLGDYPHIGSDANGIYISTNEFNFFPAGFHAAQIYAVPKQELVSGAASIDVFQFDTQDTPTVTPDFGPLPGFTVWPAQSPGASSFATANSGSEYFLSSIAVFTGLDNRVALWAMTNTQALASTAAPTLSNTLVNTVAYTNLPRVAQPGSGTNDQTKQWPLGQCLQVEPCAAVVQGLATPVPENIGRLNANDSRMQQVTFANGKLWAAFGTALSTTTDPTVRAGVVFVVLTPQNTGALKAKVVQQGYIALDGVSLTYPTMAVTAGGRGVISFTYVGPNDFASVAYSSVDALVGAGDVHLAQAGSGLQDGFTEYTNVFGGRPRWGDYGAGAADGNSIWFATEYINQSCDLATYEAGFSASFGSCGGTRTSLGNWATRITKVTP